MSVKHVASTSNERWIQAELVDVYYRNIPTAVLALNPILAALLASLLYGHVSWILLGGWFTVIVLVTALNIWRNHRYVKARARTGLDLSVWQNEFTSGALQTGIVWGAGGAFFYTPAMPLESMFVLLVICGVCAGVSGSHVALPRAAMGLIAPALIIPVLRAIQLGGPAQMVLVALMALYFGFLAFVVRTNSRNLRDSVHLRLHNQSLLDALTERERHFRSLIDNAVDWVSVVSIEGNFVFLSPSVSDLLGWQPENLEGRHALTLVHPEDRALVEGEFQRIFTQGGTATIEARWRHFDGRWVLFQALAHALEGETPTLVMNARDVTERRGIESDLRRAKEAAEVASRIKDEFLASMSHEIRTPLHAMQGMVDLMGETPLSARQTQYVAGFQQAMGHLSRLVNDVLDFSRMNAGGLTLAQEPFDLRVLLDGVVALMSPNAHAKGLDIRVQMKPAIAPLRLGDVVRLRQVLVNLIGNAVKFTDAGEVLIAVVEKGDVLHFTVSDTGRGIPAEKQALLFRPFYQVDASSTREFGGAGLGLAISRGLVEAMGGSIGVESQAGGGSAFHFYVRAPASDTAPEKEIAASEADLPSARLLVADDAELNLMVIGEFFRGTPCHLDFARNGREAVEAWQQEEYDLILMDIQMPEMDGWQATRTIRSLEKQRGRRAIPIIALTAGALDEDRSEALAVGCTDFLPKPVTKSRLLALVAAHLQLRKLVSESTRMAR